MRLAVSCVAVILGVSSGVMGAQGYSADKPLGAVAQERPAYLQHAGIDQHLGQQLPMSAVFTDETGKSAPLSSWYDGKPVVMAMVYYNCAMLCPQVLHGLAVGLKGTTLTAGKDYNVLVFSIDPTDATKDAVEQKQKFLTDAGMSGQADAVHFLTAAKPSIDALSDATGFHFVMVPGPDGKMDQYAHSSVIMFTTPDGKMSKYLAGVSYEPRDLRLALLDASEKKISNPVDLLILYCCNYSPTAGRYSVSVVRILGIAGMVTLLIVIGMVYLLTRKPKGAQ